MVLVASQTPPYKHFVPYMGNSVNKQNILSCLSKTDFITKYTVLDNKRNGKHFFLNINYKKFVHFFFFRLTKYTMLLG